MTNEELAAIAAQGERESLYKLYFAVVPLLYKLISRFFPLCREKAYTEPEDLLQCGYFAFLEAVRSFAPEKGFSFRGTGYMAWLGCRGCKVGKIFRIQHATGI